MVEDSGKVEEDVDLGYVHALMAISEPERSQWCIEVVNALADAAEKIMKMKGKLKQGMAAKEFLKDLGKKRNEILPVVYYMLKPQFRETVQELLEKFSGYVPSEEELGEE